MQAQRIIKWAKDDTIRTDAQAERIGTVRTLKLDEQAKARTAPSAAALAVDAAKWNEHTTIEEHADHYLIPRESRTSQLCLRLFKPVMVFRDEPFKVLDAESRDRLAAIARDIRRCHPDNRKAYAERLMSEVTLTYVHGSNPVLDWKSDETLLVKSKGYDNFQQIAFKRKPNRKGEQARIEKETDELPTWDDPTTT